MIVDLNLRGDLVIIVGGGNEGLKKVNTLLTQDCKILLISDSTNRQIQNYVKQKKISFKQMKLDNANFLQKYKPFMVLATTNNKELNRKIVVQAKTMRCYAYASDDPEVSDFAFGSVINIADTVQIAISTGGRSPAMARKLKIQAEQVFKKLIKKEDIYHIKLQDFARKAAKAKISTFPERRKFLYGVMNDNHVKQLIQDGNLKKAQKRVMEMLGDLI
ncbi:precorrin-2 dehydrogenase/sirohydrochlorin ferrochelatase family protein [Candidatus Nitrosotalea bavarica]|uniref:precorrin-2 dehydrogenase/sirohydrochlorin ferrochelatase family protein n=1 Tax=Candidatus Nitrosotalea bavarica TaxID=1903277 RepID=UPI000C701B96|nr:bifunctional precorrin-2 dehydrogenase/sirohydrochlorin ferrochelatase [Candidatus Nitrosotalea bavarica]